MKKIILFIFTYLIIPTTAFAQIGISRKNKPGTIPLDLTTGELIANVLQIMYIIGSLASLIFIVWGALDWILAGGEKEKIAAARKKIVYTIIGVVLLALSFFIFTLVNQITGLDILKTRCIPSLYLNPDVNKIPC